MYNTDDTITIRHKNNNKKPQKKKKKVNKWDILTRYWMCAGTQNFCSMYQVNVWKKSCQL